MFNLPRLPYAVSALAPHIGAEAMDLHYDKHHRGYVDKLNQLIAGSDYAGMDLEDIIVRTRQSSDPRDVKIFNNAGQHWNHSMYWHSLSPSGGGAPRGPLEERIAADFGTIATFRDSFVATGADHFGSGWLWLMWDGKHLSLTATHDAGNPVGQAEVALLVCDLWEHAYYPDYQNRRPEFLGRVFDHLANWRLAEERFRQRLAPIAAAP